MTVILNGIESVWTEQYSNLINYYEKSIEENPDDVNNYLWLGVSYLLMERDEEAQNTWFYLFSQGDEADIEKWCIDLEAILIDVIEPLMKQEKYHIAHLMRFNWWQLNPRNLGNILELINLEIASNSLDWDKLQEYNLLQVIAGSQLEEKDYDSLVNVTKQISKIFSDKFLDFFNELINLESESFNINVFLDKIAEKIDLFLSIHIKQIALYCLDKKPDNLTFLFTIVKVSLANKNYEEALAYTNKLLTQVNEVNERLFVSLILNLIYLETCQWQKIEKSFLEHKNLLEKCVNLQLVPQFLNKYMITISSILSYLEDQPKHNHYVKYQIGKLFQNALVSHSKISFAEQFSQINQNKKKLKIGYIASTFRRHSVCWLARWLLVNHNQDNFEVYIYGLRLTEDDITQQWVYPYVTQAYNFRDGIEILKPEAVAEKIFDDGIDILVDLDSYTNNFTCQILALKPAPIQVTWLGADVSGLPAIDYFIVDNYVLPDDAHEYYQTKLWRLPETYLAVNGFEMDYPHITRRDLGISVDATVYLNVQNAKKLNPSIIRLQMKIIKAVNNSYLLVKSSGDEEGIKRFYLTMAQEEGLDSSRLIFLPRTSTEEEHRGNLQIADVVLDTYPYNGSTTTLEALWLGLPVVTKVGQQFSARNSYTYMINVGLTEGIAWNDQEYIDWGITLGKSEELRKEIYHRLIESRQTSPLWNGKEFTKEMEKAYQHMWDIYAQKEK